MGWGVEGKLSGMERKAALMAASTWSFDRFGCATRKIDRKGILGGEHASSDRQTCQQDLPESQLDVLNKLAALYLVLIIDVQWQHT